MHHTVVNVLITAVLSSLLEVVSVTLVAVSFTFSLEV